MKGTTKAFLMSAMASGVVAGGLYWLGCNGALSIIIWVVGTVVAYPKVVQDMAYEKILNHDWPTKDGTDKR
ncbi:hypothetical protein [Rhizobium sp. MHM7A]|uniref:hypothetical protein n=1 Tax=Rhizobium sp. MHM7A TaxID=2583233 RepID=UPI0011075134|nr:hypothetical protein [Rhizobium sp. MHM7A]TLX03696.1 hypothetical protein FFR93_36040 [Rhizobium sp. MHM7A]